MSRVKGFFSARGRLRILENEMKNMRFIQSELEEKLREKDALIGEIRKEYNTEKNRKDTSRADERERAVLEIYRALSPLLMNYHQMLRLVEISPDLTAKDIMGMMRPLANLCEALEFEAIGKAGEQTAFDPKLHICETTAAPGAAVIVETVGFRRRDAILNKAQVRADGIS